MGVKGLKHTIEKHAPNAFVTIPMSKFSGKRIAIDGNYWMYKYLSSARKTVIMSIPDILVEEPNINRIHQEWFISLVKFVIKFLSYNIIPVFIFDGVHPIQKRAKQKKSREQREKLKLSIDELYNKATTPDFDDHYKVNFDLKKKLCNYTVISKDEHAMFKKLVKELGLPYFIAKGDGEQLCSSLCYEGKVAASYSRDIDNLVYRCPLTIINMYSNNSESMFECIRLDTALEGLEMSHATFVDFSIMSGCDFNTNMKGYASGRSFNLMKQCLSIDNLPSNLNTKCLDHLNCRELLSYKTSEKLTLPNNNSQLFINKEAPVRDVLKSFGIEDWTDNLLSAYFSSIAGEDGLLDELNLKLVPHYVIYPPRVKLNILTPQPTIMSV